MYELYWYELGTHKSFKHLVLSTWRTTQTEGFYLEGQRGLKSTGILRSSVWTWGKPSSPQTPAAKCTECDLAVQSGRTWPGSGKCPNQSFPRWRKGRSRWHSARTWGETEADNHPLLLGRSVCLSSAAGVCTGKWNLPCHYYGKEILPKNRGLEKNYYSSLSLSFFHNNLECTGVNTTSC